MWKFEICLWILRFFVTVWVIEKMNHASQATASAYLEVNAATSLLSSSALSLLLAAACIILTSSWSREEPLPSNREKLEGIADSFIFASYTEALLSKFEICRYCTEEGKNTAITFLGQIGTTWLRRYAILHHSVNWILAGPCPKRLCKGAKIRTNTPLPSLKYPLARRGIKYKGCQWFGTNTACLTKIRFNRDIIIAKS